MSVELADQPQLYTMRKSHRVVVTGMGAVCALGNNIPDIWQAAVKGQCGIRKISESNWDPDLKRAASKSGIDIAGLVMDFDISHYIPHKELRRMHRFSQFVVEAVRQGLIQAQLLDSGYPLERGGTPLFNVNPERIGVGGSTGIGGGTEIGPVALTLYTKGAKNVDIFSMLRLLPCRGTVVSNMFFDTRGEGFTVNAACASAPVGLANNYRVVERGDQDVMVAVSGEAAVDDIALSAFNVMRALSRRNDDPARSCTPFNQSPPGFVCGEGSACLILESLEHALKRKATILAELIGYGITQDAFHDVAPNKKSDRVYKGGPARAMRKCLEMAGIEPSQVGHINTHGTGTDTGDGPELDAMEEVFGDCIADIPITSTKQLTGHLLGAAGGLESVFTVLSILHGEIPPIPYLDNPIRKGFYYVTPNSIRKKIRIAMTNNFGFGGQNASLLFREYTGI